MSNIITQQGTVSGARQLRVTPSTGGPGLMAHGASRPIPSLGSNWPGPAFKLPHMQRHTAPQAIKLWGLPSPARCYWWSHQGQWCIGTCSAPAGQHRTGPLSSHHVGGEALCPPIDLLGLGVIDRSNLQEFMVLMWGWLTFCATAVQYGLVTAFND